MQYPTPFFLAAIFFGLIGCQQQAQKQESTPPPPEATIVDDGSIFSVLIAHQGTVVSEQYFNGKTQDSLCDVQSLTKGLMSILVGIAIDRGEIASLDEPIADYFPEILREEPAKSAITIRHLLNQTSGLAWQGHLEHADWLGSASPNEYVLKKELVATPGQVYNYNSGATHLLSAILTQATGMPTLGFAEEVLFEPLDFGPVAWQIRNDGHYDGSGLGLKMRPVDLMKLGQLLANQGTWHDQSVVSADWVAQLFGLEDKMPTEWGLRNSKHGMCWYAAEYQGQTIHYGMGYGGQFILIMPDLDLVVVTTHNADTPDGIDQQITFLKRDLPKLIATYGG